MKKLSKLMVAFVGLVMSVAFVGCENLSLQELADKNQNFPKVDDGLVVNKSEVVDNYFVFYGDIIESKAPKDFLTKEELDPAEFKSISNDYKNKVLKNEEWKKVFQQCKKEKKGVKMILKGDVTGKTITLFDIPAEQLQSMEF